jgi:hypothetical protein
MRPYLEKPSHKKIGLVEWLKVKALSANLSTTKTKQNKKLYNCTQSMHVLTMFCLGG